MRPLLRKSHGWLWLLVLTLLVVRTTDAHVHLCLDGQEPRSSLHVEDRAGLCNDLDDAAESHNDKDVEAVATALAKKAAENDSLLPLPVLAAVLFVLPVEQGTVVLIDAPDLVPDAPYYSLPLLRGPPAA